MSFPNQTKLPRCQFGVTDYNTMEGVSGCDEPAVALWDWGSDGSLYVCEKHNDIIETKEELGDIL